MSPHLKQTKDWWLQSENDLNDLWLLREGQEEDSSRKEKGCQRTRQREFLWFLLTHHSDISLIPILVGLSCSGSKCQKQKEMKMSLLLPKNRKEIKILSLIFKSSSKEIHLYGTVFYFTNDIINKISSRSVALAFVSSDVFQLPSRGTS